MNNISIIRESFKNQAGKFDSNNYHLSKSDYQNYMIDKVMPQKSEQLLEVAAGTCICGRAFAPYVSYVTCLDATTEMLECGKKKALSEGISNIMFIKGIAEELPFLDNSFDIVISRLAFHHFVNPENIFDEMKRVLKQHGKLVIMDMTMEDKTLRTKVDDIERMRDFSHIKELTFEEMSNLYINNNVRICFQEKIDVPVDLENWMEFTNTPELEKNKIREFMKQDIENGELTGFFPYIESDRVKFNHHWVLNIGEKL